MYLIVCVNSTNQAYIGELNLGIKPIIFHDRVQAIECACTLNDGSLGTVSYNTEWVVRTIHGDKLQDT